MRYIGLFLLLLTFSAGAQTNIFNEKDFSLIYPSNWDTAHYTTIPVLYAPIESADDGFRENINIVTEKATGVADITVDEYVQLSIENLEPTLGDDVKKIKKSTIKIGKNQEEGRLMQYNTTKFADDGSELTLWQAVIKTNKKFFIITYTSKPDSYSTYIKDVEDIVKSIRFK